MRTLITRFVVPLALAATFSSCAQQAATPVADLAADEQAIRALNERWVAAIAAKDTVAIGNFYAEDAHVLPANMARVDGRDAARSVWAWMMTFPNMSFTFAATEVVVASAGDMAYDIGTFEFSFDGPKGRVEDKGKYATIWKKVGGEWKVVVDIFNSDHPAAGAP